MIKKGMRAVLTEEGKAHMISLGFVTEYKPGLPDNARYWCGGNVQWLTATHVTLDNGAGNWTREEAARFFTFCWDTYATVTPSAATVRFIRGWYGHERG